MHMASYLKTQRKVKLQIVGERRSTLHSIHSTNLYHNFIF